jgi:hypothetical protein
MAGWKIRKNDWYVIDIREVKDGGEGILRRETSLSRAETRMARYRNLPLIERVGGGKGHYLYAYGPDAAGEQLVFEVVRGFRLSFLAQVRVELNVAPKYPYARVPYETPTLINRAALLADPYFVQKQLARITLPSLGVPSDAVEEA